MRLYVAGIGAVSPAGWGLEPLRNALSADSVLPTQNIAPQNRLKPLRARLVPTPPVRPAFLTHPRLRRTSPITHYAAAAGLEALESAKKRSTEAFKIGLICCFQSGCVQYSCRFFEETLKDPASASPLVFPETVFAAPTSHIAALLGNVATASSLVADPAGYLQGIALAAHWLNQGIVRLCLVIGAEENHWLLADALWHFQHTAVFASGAGALALSADPGFSIGVELSSITDAHTFVSGTARTEAARRMRAQMPEGGPEDLLVDGLDSSPRTDEAESSAWVSWSGRRLSPKRILGEGLMASAAWQCVAGCDAIAQAKVRSALVSLVGCNQQAIGARFLAH